MDVGQPSEQLLEQDANLGARQVRAQTEVWTGPEREVQVRRAIDTEGIGSFEHVGITVRRGIDVEQHVVLRESTAPQLGWRRDGAREADDR